MRNLCERTDMPLAILTAQGTPDDNNPRTFEINKSAAWNFVAEIGCDCFMHMHALAPKERPANRDETEWAAYAAELELSFHIHTNRVVNS